MAFVIIATGQAQLHHLHNVHDYGCTCPYVGPENSDYAAGCPCHDPEVGLDDR